MARSVVNARKRAIGFISEVNSTRCRIIARNRLEALVAEVGAIRYRVGAVRPTSYLACVISIIVNAMGRVAGHCAQSICGIREPPCPGVVNPKATEPIRVGVPY